MVGLTYFLGSRVFLSKFAGGDIFCPGLNVILNDHAIGYTKSVAERVQHRPSTAEDLEAPVFAIGFTPKIGLPIIFTGVPITKFHPARQAFEQPS